MLDPAYTREIQKGFSILRFADFECKKDPISKFEN